MTRRSFLAAAQNGFVAGATFTVLKWLFQSGRAAEFFLTFALMLGVTVLVAAVLVAVDRLIPLPGKVSPAAFTVLVLVVALLSTFSIWIRP